MFSLTLRDLAGRDDPECLAALGMGNDQDPFGARNSYGNKAVLRFGVVWIRKRERQGIAKNGGCFLKGYPMFPAVPSSLARVPFKIHNFILLYFVGKKRLPFAEDANGHPTAAQSGQVEGSGGFFGDVPSVPGFLKRSLRKAAPPFPA